MQKELGAQGLTELISDWKYKVHMKGASPYKLGGFKCVVAARRGGMCGGGAAAPVLGAS